MVRRLGPEVLEGIAAASRPEYCVPGPRENHLSINFEPVVAFHDVPPFVLVAVKGPPGKQRRGVLRAGECVASVNARDLYQDVVAEHVDRSAGAVTAQLHDKGPSFGQLI